MRVLVIASEVPPVTSGLSRVTGTLATGLEARGHQVDLVSAADYPRAVFGEFRFSGFVSGWSSMSRAVSGYDLVNVHGPAPTLSDAFLALVRTIPRRWRPPIVYTHHFDIDIKGFDSLCRPYNRFTRALASVADHVLVSSPSYAEIMKSRNVPISVIPWARPQVGTELSHPPRKDAPLPLKVLFVGQMRPYKGLPVLLEAVGNDPRFSLTVAGDGPELDAYQRLAMDICPNARFVGNINDAELQVLYAESHVIALPSVRKVEAFGLVLLEGMAAGCVAVASDLPGVRDVASPAGFTVPPGDARELNRTLARLAEDQTLLSKLSREAIRFSSRFTEAKFIRSTEEVFAGVVNEHRSAQLHQPLPIVGKREISPSLADLNSEFGSSWCSVMWLDNDHIKLHQAWGHAATIVDNTRTSAITRSIAERDTPILIDALLERPTGTKLRHRADVGSAIAAPVRSTDGFVGVVCLTRSADIEQRYSHDDAVKLATRLRQKQRWTVAQ
jgi:glycosyltransferase involved in cell wall biosynthesis